MNKMKVIKIHPNDNVAVAIEPLEQGEAVEVDGQRIELSETIPAGHKLALTPIARGETVFRYGFPIGTATAPIPAGAWAHEHNVRTNLSGHAHFNYEPAIAPLPPIDDGLTFDGYVRSNGEAGIRNELWIVPMVGCTNRIAEELARRMNAELSGGAIDGVHAFPHPHGCSSLGLDHERMQRVLAGLVKHPNAGGVLVLALGCETNTLTSFKNVLGDYDPDRVRFLTAQNVEDEIDAGMEVLRELAGYAARFKRSPCRCRSSAWGSSAAARTRSRASRRTRCWGFFRIA